VSIILRCFVNFLDDPCYEPLLWFMIRYHSKSLSCKIFGGISFLCSQFMGQLTVSQDSLFRITWLHNRGVCVTCELCKSENVSNHCQTIGWLSIPLLIQHRTLCAMLDHYTSRGILFIPPIQYGCHHTHETRCPTHFANIAWHFLNTTFISWLLSLHGATPCHKDFSVTYHFKLSL